MRKAQKHSTNANRVPLGERPDQEPRPDEGQAQGTESIRIVELIMGNSTGEQFI